MNGAIPPLPSTPLWRGAQLKHSGNFTSYLNIYKFYSYIKLIILLTAYCIEANGDDVE